MLVVYDINGRKIIELANGTYDRGIHQFTWNGIDSNGLHVSSGMYIYSLISNSVIKTEKMLLIK